VSGAGTAVVVAVDCSTTSSKALALDGSGRVLAQAGSPIPTSRPHPSWHEQDPLDWWRATRTAIREAVARLDRPDEVRALCLTHQRETFVALDDEGRATRPAICWIDARAHAEIAELGTPAVHEASGKPPDTTPAIYKVAWLARHEPEALARAERVGDVQAYLACRLTGRWTTSDASADTLGILDLRTGNWSDDLLAVAGVRRDQLPDLVPAGAPIGPLLPDVADDLGVPRGTVLVAGLGDGQSAGLALGAATPGVAYLNLGTSMVLGVRADSYVWGHDFRTLAGMVPGTVTLEAFQNAASYLASWFRSELGAPGQAAPDELDALAAQVPTGSEGLLALPYWNAAQTPHWDPLARGAFVGLHGHHTRAHLYRAVLEGVALDVRGHLHRLEAATERAVDSVRVVGGGSRSALWTQILADATGRTLQVSPAEEASALGAGVLALAHLGIDPGPLADAGVVVRTPDAGATARYAELAPVFDGLYAALRPTFTALARLRDA
jgi:xylulokinase